MRYEEAQASGGLILMKARMAFLLVVCVLFGATGIAAIAQDTQPGPAKVLVIDREYLKPGKGGSLHEKTEAAFVKALGDAKSATHYIALDSLSGETRTLFFLPYDSFEAGKEQESIQANTSLSSALDQATIDDGELLSQAGTTVYLYHPEMSLHTTVEIPHMRYFEISRYVIKPGHAQEWRELAKLYVNGFEKMPEVHWAAYESMYGENNGGVWIVINPMKSLDEVDKGLASGKQFESAVGEASLKHLSELAATCIQSEQTNVFAVNTKISYAADEWAKTAPEVWGRH
jgi:hypothetical protein